MSHLKSHTRDVRQFFDLLVTSLIKIFLYLDFVDVRRLLDRVSLPREEVLRQRVEDVGAEDDVLADLARNGIGVLDDWDVHVNDLKLVRKRNLEGRLQNVQKFWQRLERHVLGAVWIKLLPDFVEEIVVFVRDALLDILCSLGVVFQDHSDVHVDDDEEAENEVNDHEGDAGHVVAAISRISGFCIWKFAVRLVGDGRQSFGPTG